MTLVFIITAALTLLILIVFGVHLYLGRHIMDRWKENAEELSPLVSSMPISIVVVSHNEGRNMESNIPLLFAQKGAEVEIIVVNAASTDTTIDALKRLTLQYPQLRQTYVPQSNTNINVWETAYMLGARAARNEWVLYVSSSFTPDSDLWLIDLLRYTDPSVKAVIDYANIGQSEHEETKMAWKRRCKKMTRTVRKGRAIVTGGGSLLMKRGWILDHAGDNERGECIYVCRRFPPLQRLILRARNHRPDFSNPL